MKRSFLIAAMIFIYAASTAQTRSYTITGTAPQGDLNGKNAYLYDISTKKNADSTLIQDGKFVFKGKTEGNSGYSINIGRINRPFVLEGGEIYIDFVNQKIGGTPLNDIFDKYEKEMDGIRKSATEEQRQMGSDKSLNEEARRAKAKELYTKTNDKMMEIALNYVKFNKNNAVCALVINNNIRGFGDNKELFDKFYNNAGEYAKKFPPVVAAVKRFEALDKVQVGKPFIDFTIANGNLDGTSVSLSDYVGKGKYILVDFWASWCGPCKAEIPNIANVYNEFKGDKFDVLSIAVWDEREKTIKAAKEHNIIWNQIIDAQRIPTELYGIAGIPQIMLFGPDGKIVAKGIRGENVRKAVAEALGK
jgi:thiol-disulfide isomerase/thioredoxin